MMLENVVATNREGNYQIIADGFSGVHIDYVQAPFIFETEIEEQIAAARKEKEGDPKFRDELKVRIYPESIGMREGLLCMRACETSFLPHIATRKPEIPVEKSAFPLSIGAITLNMENGDYYAWFGKKNPKANEAGGGQIQIIPAGYIDPHRDFDTLDGSLRELHEEMLRIKLVTRGQIDVYRNGKIDVYRNLGRELFSGEDIGQDIQGTERHFMELKSRVFHNTPFALTTGITDARNPMLLYLIALDMPQQEIMASWSLIPKGDREYDDIRPVRFTVTDLLNFYSHYHEELRPHARAAIDAALRNYADLTKRLEASFQKYAVEKAIETKG